MASSKKEKKKNNQIDIALKTKLLYIYKPNGRGELKPIISKSRVRSGELNDLSKSGRALEKFVSTPSLDSLGWPVTMHGTVKSRFRAGR